MPIKIPNHLPATEILKAEQIFVMDEHRATHQDIRPLKIIIANLMPNKQETEVQLMRLIGNTPLQIEIRLLHMESHRSQHTSADYLATFYEVFDDIKHEKFDGMIITGAPVEQMPFEEVTYWKELTRIMEWSKSNVTSTFHICWGAQAGLYYHYGVPKHSLEEKRFGIFPHTKNKTNVNLLRGFDDIFYVPHSRHTETRAEDIRKCPFLDILSESDESGVYLVSALEGRQVFVTGHSEYDVTTLLKEYTRDVEKGEVIQIPKHYFKNDDPTAMPMMTWRSHANLLYSNWLNYYVYQETPYDLA